MTIKINRCEHSEVFEIKLKIRASIIIALVTLNIVLVSSNFGLIATDLKSDSNNIEDQSSRSRSRSNGIINWSQIEVLSEPVSGQNFNTGISTSAGIAVEGDKIYVVWMDGNNTNNAGTDYDIFYRHFDGNSWSEIQVISEPQVGQNLNTDVSESPSIAVENGKIYVAWDDYSDLNGAGTDEDIFFRCNLTGSNWEDIQVISEPVPSQGFNSRRSTYPDIDVENGNIYVVWNDYNDTNGAGLDTDIFYRCNLTGTSWEPVQVISEPIFGQDNTVIGSYSVKLAVENSKVYVTWVDENNYNGAGFDNDIFYRANLTGTSWEEIQVISEPVPGQNINTAITYGSDIAVENGKIYIVWLDYNNTNGAGTDSDIVYRCNITGSSWEPEHVISEPVPGQNFNTGNSGGAWILVEDGNIHVAWGDGNNTNNSGTDTDVFYRCNLKGIYWEPVQVISEPVPGQNINTGGSGGPSIVIDNNKLHIVWGDDNNTNGVGTDADIFYKWKYFVSPSLFLGYPKVSPVSGNTSTEFNFTVKYYQLNNTPPSTMKVMIDGIEHSMLEVNSSNTNYINGKGYFFNSNNLEIGMHTYEFNASDGLNFTDTNPIKNFIVRNTLPRILTENNLTAVADEYYEVIYEFEDLDMATVGQICNWEFSTNASWLDFESSTTKLYGTPTNDDVGQYWVNISVFDSIDIVDNNFTLKVIDINYAPIINTNNQELAIEDELYEVDYDASDIDSPLNFQIWSLETNASNWFDIDKSSGILKGIPENDDVGSYWVNVTVNDGAGGTDWANFTLTVIDTNDAPIIITENKTTTFEDKLYSINYIAFDIDDPAIFEWFLNTNASWLRINNVTGLLSGIPKNDDVGTYYVNITVEDVRNGNTSQNFTLTVLNVNDPPEWDSIPKDTFVNEGELFTFDVNAIDMDPSEILKYYMNTKPVTDITINPDTGMIEWIASIRNLSEPQYAFEVILFVTDGKVTITSLFNISVILNPRPTTELISPANEEFVSALGTELKWDGNDQLGESLTYDVYLSEDKNSIDGLIETMLILNRTTDESFFINDVTIGNTYYWTIIPSDGLNCGECTDGIFSFTINSPPKLSFIGRQKATVGKKFGLEVDASDSNPDDIKRFQFSLIDAPNGMIINPETGKITWTPTKDQIGNHTVTVRVDDGLDQTNILFEIQVTEQEDENIFTTPIMIITTFSILIIVIITAFIGGTEVGKYKFFSLFFIPLYNKLNPNRVLDNFVRGKIIGYIRAKPGDHYNTIKYSLELKNGTFAHHTKVLEKEGLIRIQRDGLYTRFYPQGARISEPKSPPLKEVQEELLDVICHDPGITQHEIIKLLKLSQRIISYNLIKLRRNGLIDVEANGREKKYYLRPVSLAEEQEENNYELEEPDDLEEQEVQDEEQEDNEEDNVEDYVEFEDDMEVDWEPDEEPEIEPKKQKTKIKPKRQTTKCLPRKSSIKQKKAQKLKQSNSQLNNKRISRKID